MAILVTWNPETKNPDYSWVNQMAEASRLTLTGKPYGKDWWNCKTKDVRVGDRLFLLRQAVEPKGIVGSGWATSERENIPMPKSGDIRPVVYAVFDLLLDPHRFRPLDCRSFTKGPLSKVNWNTQFSGLVVPDELEAEWRQHVDEVLGYLPFTADEDMIDLDELEYPEGRGAYRLHRYIERNSPLINDAKAKAKQDGRFYCWVCDFDFSIVFGERGEGYIEAHHIIPVSNLRENDMTKISDIAMVCSNCHRMLHRTPWVTVEKLRDLITKIGRK